MAPETSFSMEDITSIWTLEMGFPVVFVKNVVGKTNQCHLRQQWFLADGSQKTADKKKVWQVPIMHFSKNNPKNNNFDPYFLNKPEVTIDVGKIQNKHANRFQPCGGLVNEERWSFFRVHYEADQMASIVQYMSDAENAHYKYEEYFSPTAKIGVVSDALAMGKSGYSDMTWSLKIIEVMRSERNPNVLRQISSVLGSFKGVLNDLSSTTNSSEYRAAYREFKKFAWAFVIDGVKELGFVNQPGEDDTRKRLRGFLGFAAGYCANDPWVKEQAETQWEMFGQNRSSVSPDARPAVFTINVVNKGEPALNQLIEWHSTCDDPSERNDYYTSMGAVRDENQKKRVLEFGFSPAVRSQDSTRVLASVAKSQDGSTLTSNWIFANFDKIRAALGSDKLLKSVVKISGWYLYSEQDAQRVGNFWKSKNLDSLGMIIAQTVEGIRINTAFANRVTKSEVSTSIWCKDISQSCQSNIMPTAKWWISHPFLSTRESLLRARMSPPSAATTGLSKKIFKLKLSFHNFELSIIIT